MYILQNIQASVKRMPALFVLRGLIPKNSLHEGASGRSLRVLNPECNSTGERTIPRINLTHNFCKIRHGEGGGKAGCTQFCRGARRGPRDGDSFD